MVGEVITESLVLIKNLLRIQLPSIFLRGAIISERIINVNLIIKGEVNLAFMNPVNSELSITVTHKLKTHIVDFQKEQMPVFFFFFFPELIMSCCMGTVITD